MTVATTPVPSVTEAARLVALDRYGLLPDSTPAPGDEQRDTALRRLAQLAAQVCGTGAAAVNIITADAQWQVATHGIEPGVCSRGESMCAVSFTSGRTTAVADASTDLRYAANPWVTGVLGRVRLYASAPLLTADGVALGALCVFDDDVRPLTDEQVQALETLAQQVVDVLDLQLRTRELRAAGAELTRSNEALGEFAGRVAHDLRSPLAAITGFAEVAEEELIAHGVELPGEPLGRIRRAAGRMDTLLAELLAFASVGGRPELSTVVPADLVDDVREDLAAAIAESGAEVVGTGPAIRADRSQVRALLQNTVGNAIAYRRPGARCRVEVAAERLPTGWCLRVVDHGPGIPPEEREHVLTPFVRGSTNRGVPGTGLGLATAARVAAAHGARIHLDETPGGGLTVTVTVEATPPV